MQTKTSNRLRDLVCFMVLACMMAACAYVGLDQLDRSIYPGCKVLSQSGKILTIQINPEIDTGSDSGYAAGSKIIYQICQDGYKVRVANWPWPKETFSLAKAKELYQLAGAPVPQ